MHSFTPRELAAELARSALCFVMGTGVLTCLILACVAMGAKL